MAMAFAPAGGVLLGHALAGVRADVRGGRTDGAAAPRDAAPGPSRQRVAGQGGGGGPKATSTIASESTAHWLQKKKFHLWNHFGRKYTPKTKLRLVVFFSCHRQLPLGVRTAYTGCSAMRDSVAGARLGSARCQLLWCVASRSPTQTRK